VFARCRVERVRTSDDPPRVGLGATVYTDDGEPLGTVRGFDENGCYVTTEECPNCGAPKEGLYYRPED